MFGDDILTGINFAPLIKKLASIPRLYCVKNYKDFFGMSY